MTAKKLNYKQVQWSLYLARFNFVLHYYSGKFVGKLNTLSHWLDYRNGLYDNENVVLLKLEFLAVWMMKKIVLENKE